MVEPLAHKLPMLEGEEIGFSIPELSVGGKEICEKGLTLKYKIWIMLLEIM